MKKEEKLERKRERNRLAARRCRQRKMEIIDELRKEVAQWEQKYKELEMGFEQFKNSRIREIETLQRDMENTPRESPMDEKMPTHLRHSNK